MNIEEVHQFLASIAPFDELQDDELDQWARRITVSYCRAGEALPTDGNRLLIVRTGRFALHDADGQLMATLQPGDFFGVQQLMRGSAPTVSLQCEEDSLQYWLDARHFERLCQRSPAVETFFNHLLERRLHRHRQADSSHAMMRIAEVVPARRVGISPEASVQEAAHLMTQERVSSLLVAENERLCGIITDRDLRSRVVAAGKAGNTPVAEVMTPDPQTVRKDAFLFEAVQIMSMHNVHHLPVLDAAGKLHGMVTTSDVIRNQQADPVYIISQIHRQRSAAALRESASQLRDLSRSLSRQQVPAHQASQVLTTVTDALTQAWIRLAIEELGPPPCMFSWLAFGSQARREQAMNADQDNALLLEKEPTGAIADYFAALATRVCDGLNDCGIVFCPGNIMASNPDLRLSLRGWSARFASWLQTPTPDALMRSSIFFDMRCIEGSNSLANALQQDVLARCRDNQLFLYHLAHNALDGTPPLGFFKTFTLERDGRQNRGLDLKKRGLILLTDLTRVYALSTGMSLINTRQRLQQLGRDGTMEVDHSQNLLDAFDVLAQLRWDKQQRDIANNEPVSNLLDPATLSGLQRHQLKDVFEVINQAQRQMRYRFCREL